MKQTQFASLMEKLDAMRDTAREIEFFMKKHIELFKVLNEKFPKIGQFSNALKDTNELFMFTEHLINSARECQEEIKTIEDSLRNEKNDINNINKTIGEILTKIGDIQNVQTLQNDMRAILSKMENS